MKIILFNYLKIQKHKNTRIQNETSLKRLATLPQSYQLVNPTLTIGAVQIGMVRVTTKLFVDGLGSLVADHSHQHLTFGICHDFVVSLLGFEKVVKGFLNGLDTALDGLFLEEFG